ncbi:MAG: hypothetical protein AAGI24_07480 [Pseudomonadota bacterium]
MNTLPVPLVGRVDQRQIFKIAVYSLLFINFILYLMDDLRIVAYTMRNGGSLLQWLASFTTTIDLTGWFVLLFLFELETWVLSDETQARKVVAVGMQGVRLLCYSFLAHSVYSFGKIYLDLSHATAIAGATDLCQLVAPDISFVRNLEYTDLSLANCSALSQGSQFFFTEPGLVVSDAAGLALETRLALADWAEVIIWLLILLTIEVMVRLQDRGRTRGMLINAIKTCKVLCYTLLWGIAAYWLTLGHYRFAYDESLWILGFITIESNMQAWKREIEAARQQAVANEPAATVAARPIR